MLEPGALVLIYLLAAAVAIAVSYWVIRLAVAHGIRDSRKPEKVKAEPAAAPPAQTWFSQDA